MILFGVLNNEIAFTNMAHDVFISYSHKDKNVADAVCSIMEKNAIRCWIAPRDITPGAPFGEAIIDGIKESKVFVLVYSSNSNKSNQVIKEVDRAVHHGLAIIPLRLEDVPMSKQLEYYVSDVHWLDALTPPLEKHINKLCNVVEMLLTMDEIDSDDIKEAFKPEIIDQAEADKAGRRFKLARILIPAVSALLIVIILGAVLFFKRQSKIRWAREVVLPKIDQLIKENDVWRNLVEPYRLAVQAEAILREDSALVALIRQCSVHIDVLTEPPGARVFMKEYVHPEAEWTFLGITPLDNVRVPIGIFRWKLEKEGYVPVMAAASTWDIGGKDIVSGYNLVRTMDRRDSLPADMVRIPATETEIGPLGDFFIGRYEVTNRGYKAFVDAGGYRKQEYWKHPFVKDGGNLTWEESIGMFVDQTGRPGPATWLGGDFPEGQGNYPVSGVSWYEAAAYAEWVGMNLPTSIHWDVARGGPKYLTIIENANTYTSTELMVQEVKDLRRSIDYLQTRPDIDAKKIAYMGMSWGAELGAIIPAVEDRFKASVLIAGGLSDSGRPEAREINYVSRVLTPTLMLNGKYDVIYPPQTSSNPMLDLLGTPPEHKRLIFYETDHVPPRADYIKEVLAWLDKYLGPVK